MLAELTKKLWRMLPYKGRLLLIRATQTKFTVSVVAVVLNNRNEVLVLDHYIRPGFSWGLPGGFIDPGEHPLTAVKRELREETDLDLENIELLEVQSYRRHLEILFRATAVGEARVSSREIKSLGWFTAETIPEGMNPEQREMVIRMISAAE